MGGSHGRVTWVGHMGVSHGRAGKLLNRMKLVFIIYPLD